MREIYIRKLPYEDARFKLEREIQAAFMERVPYVEIIHGIGEGILKRMVHEYIQSQDYLKLLATDEEILRSNPGSTKVEILLPR